MHEIFINYWTKGGKELAYMCDRALSDRFGTDSVFLARKSIDLGNNYVNVLVQAARRSRVLLALIDDEWLTAPDRHRAAGRALDNPDDWVRREIEEALEAGALVIPVLLGRRTEQLDPRRLPRSIAELAECQYTRVELSSFDTDVTALGDRMAQQVPALATLDADRRTRTPEPSESHPSVRTDGQRGGIGNVSGSVGTFVNDAHGPLHTGRGDQYSGPYIQGDGTNYVAGDHNGDIRQGFGTRAPRGGDKQ
ncbi:TIR domain-containing protein [Streptomyces sp. NPDC057806]|uniref:TIR domain-containing protein n=1 Tax=Streptomyces sp. NPDC057806 TaxID=3346255 RepID=UPI003681D8A2